MHYILKGKMPVRCNDIWEFARWFGTADRRVAYDEIGGVLVSTVFLGIDHRFNGSGPPILFETMVFLDAEGTDDIDQRRYCTWEQAEDGHQAIVAELRRVAASVTITCSSQ
jgi:hypothetical protein